MHCSLPCSIVSCPSSLIPLLILLPSFLVALLSFFLVTLYPLSSVPIIHLRCYPLSTFVVTLYALSHILSFRSMSHPSPRRNRIDSFDALIGKPGVVEVCFSSINRKLLRWLLLDKPESDDILLLPGIPGAAGSGLSSINEY